MGEKPRLIPLPRSLIGLIPLYRGWIFCGEGMDLNQRHISFLTNKWYLIALPTELPHHNKEWGANKCFILVLYIWTEPNPQTLSPV